MVYENIITGVEEDKLLPYEKCLEYGATALDNAELLAAIIRTGTNGLSSIELAEKLLESAGNLDRKSTRLNSSHITRSRMPSSA